MTGSLVPDTVTGLYRLRSEATPEGAAFSTKCADGHWRHEKWAEFWRDVEIAAHALNLSGISRGDVVGILLPTSRNWELVQQAAMQAGAAVLGHDLSADPSDIRQALRHANAKVVVAADQYAPVLVDLLSEGVEIILVGQQKGRQADEFLRWNEFISSAASNSHLPILRDPSPSDLATIIYTSGTTGTAKGIEISHGKLMVACRSLVEAYSELGPDDTTICWLPMSALFQRMANLLSVACGMHIFFADDPRSILSCLSELEPTFLVGVPRFFEKLEEATRQVDGGMGVAWASRLKYMISGSAPLEKTVLESLQARGILVLEAYGLSENTVPIATNRASAFRFGSVGRPLPANEVCIAGDDEILVRGEGLFLGYREEARRSSDFNKDGFYHTGDCGRIDDKGFLYLTGRKSEFFKLSTGKGIAPARIEAVYRQCNLVDQIVIVGAGRKHVAALIVVNKPALESAMNGVGREQSTDQGEAPMSLEKLLLRELGKFDDSLKPFERIQAVGVLEESLRVDLGELTPTQKVRRKAVEARHAALIDALYRAPAPCVLFASTIPASRVSIA